jgi:hypothetical protein
VHLEGQHALVGVDVKQTASVDDEAHLVLVVPMLAIESREHLLEA